jgi:hypothetical protein
MRLNAKETQCVRVLAKWFDSNRSDSSIQEIADFQSEGLDVDHESLVTLLKVMEQCGAIEKVLHASSHGGEFLRFDISPHTVQIVRELDEQQRKAEEPGDIVSQMTEKARRHPVLARLIIGFLLVTTAVTFINQGVQLVTSIVGVFKPSPPQESVIKVVYPPPANQSADPAKDK